MTTDLTKTFFDTFGIEPKITGYEIYGVGHKVVSQEPIYDYPQITDRTLLELVCICSQYGFCPTAKNIKDLKLKVLERFIELKKYEHQNYHNAIARKIRTLFKEQ